MTKKVKVTQEQADAFLYLKRNWSDDEIISKVVKGKVFNQHYNNVFEDFGCWNITAI